MDDPIQKQRLETIMEQARRQLFILWGRDYPNVRRDDIRFISAGGGMQTMFVCFFHQYYRSLDYSKLDLCIRTLYRYAFDGQTDVEFNNPLLTEYLKTTSADHIHSTESWGKVLAFLCYKEMRHDLEDYHCREYRSCLP